MKEKQRIDKILEAVHRRIEEEVGGLIGAELQLSLSSNEIISKEDFFDQPLGKQIFAKIDIVGDVEGKGGLLVSVKDAIRLGGTLIMLPPAELDEVANSETYDGETEDSYGEIANIIAGAYTTTFEEMFPKVCRFVRKEQEVLIPIKVDPESDEPVPDGQYYMVSAAMQLDGKQMSNLIMLMPAEPFGLVEQQDVKKQDQAQEDSLEDRGVENAEMRDTTETEEVAVSQQSDSDEVSELKEETVDKADAESAEQENHLSKKKKFDVEKHKKRVDSLLDACRAKVEEEVGALLGVEVTCSDLKNQIVQKEQFFFDEASGKQVVVYLDVVGDMEDKCYLFVGLKDAIRIGSTLIMLPPNELETAVTEEDFGDDSQDAYGEIANIIAGVYTGVFEEQYIKSFRFIKKELEQVVPMKVDIGSDTPMPDQAYYMSSMKFIMEGNEYGKVQLLFPAPLLQLEAIASVANEAVEVSDSAANEGVGLGSEKSEPGGQQGGSGNGTLSIAPGHFKETDILIVSNSDPDTTQISEVLRERGYTSSVLSFRDNVNNYLPGKFKAVFMVTNDLDEQLFGMAIKISTACCLPLIAAGTDWTRTKVIKAVKYGVTDILLIPAEKSDIEEKISNNIVKMAA